MLRNHGLLTVGRSVADAVQAMYLFETVCTIQVRAQAGGGELVHVDPAIIATAPSSSRAGHARAGRVAHLARPAAPARPPPAGLRQLSAPWQKGAPGPSMQG
jgi:ribulose-5-phosphate 4-epimerase/fuculose-1-phosphate aldolase